MTIATNMAGRGTDIKLGKGVAKAGGLHIIGTERHEARRIDRQLRGRSGRQGDPGSSTFYLSLEDDLMRLFQSDRVATIMDKLGVQEGEVIEHKFMTKAIERAQKRVEEQNFGIRKHLLEYDNVMNKQREIIYGRRLESLEGRVGEVAVGATGGLSELLQATDGLGQGLKEQARVIAELERKLREARSESELARQALEERIEALEPPGSED